MSNPIPVTDHAPNGRCCTKDCGKPTANPDDLACADCCALLGRLLDEGCRERGISPEQLYANLNAYCDEMKRKRPRA